MAFLSAGQRGITFYAGTTGMIFDSTLNWPLRWFHQMLDNEDDASHYPYSFSSETCNVHGKGPEACDAMCGSAKAMFGSIEATRKCLQLAFLWQASMTFTNEAGRELIREVETRMSPNQTLDLLKFDGMTVFRQTYECAEASCRNDGSACNYNFDSVLSFLEGNVSTGAPIMDGSFCEGVHPIPNVDIAGPGVSVAPHSVRTRMEQAMRNRMRSGSNTNLGLWASECRFT